MLGTSLAQAQANKYQRPGKKEAAPIAPAPGTATDKAAAPAGAAPNVSKGTDTKSEKVDIQQIEQDYWQQKDTEFHVVQSRRFTKEKRPFVNVGYGVLINDSFNRGGAVSVSGGYYYKEQMGFEISYLGFSADDSKTTKEIFELDGAPTYARPINQIGATWNWMPIYGKVSVFDKTIIYFDMGIHVGAGIATYERVLENTPAPNRTTRYESDTAPMLILDISQQFFINEKWAFRFDVKNRFYNQDLKKYDDSSDTKKDMEHNIDAVFGFTYYFK